MLVGATTGPQAKVDSGVVTEVLVRSIVYRLINKIATFARFGGLPGIEELPRFIKLLARMREDHLHRRPPEHGL